MNSNSKDSPLRYEIKGVRTRAEMTQQMCADVMGVSLRTWIRWETGATKMPYFGWEYYKIMSANHEVNETTSPDEEKEKLNQLYTDMISGEEHNT
jgi:DNA-binding XRE family transcriptional regulator